MEIVLASNSPRRRELMKKVVPDFTVFPVGIDETSVEEEDPVRFAVQAAVLKARAAAERHPAALIVAADTVVAAGSRILGKPDDRDEASRMLHLLSGREHRVITGVALFRQSENRLLTGWELTHVTFRQLSSELIDSYLDRMDFMDKAGSYAIQDVGGEFVESIRGDYDNVVGFPTGKIRRLIHLFERPTLLLKADRPAFPAAGARAAESGRRYYLCPAVAGDTVRVQVIRERRRIVETETIEIVEPSPDRVTPRCPHFGQCGGCLFQDLSYPRQLDLKTNHLRRELEKSGLKGLSPEIIEPVIASPAIFEYRNKMEFAFGGQGRTLRLGLRERAGRIPFRRTVGLKTCPIFGQTFEKVAPLILDFARDGRLEVHDPETGEGTLRHLVIREGKTTGQVMVILVTAEEDIAGLTEAALSLKKALPALAGFYQLVTRRQADVVTFEKTKLVFGLPYIEEKLERLTFRIRPPTFFQTNTLAAERLYGRIRDRIAAEKGARVLGLYCGAGVLETFVSSSAAAVTGVDSLPENIASACENAAINGIDRAAFIAGRVEKVPAELSGSFDFVIVDPPRAGLSPKALNQVLKLGVSELIYVSCNPASLGRDLAAATTAGYRIMSIMPFDFFPHTPHLETLVFLEK